MPAECVSGLYLYIGRCEAICPPSTYPGINAKERAACMPCHYTCLTCAGESEGHCTSCHDEAVLVPSGAENTRAPITSEERYTNIETMDENMAGGVKIEELPDEGLHLSWGKRLVRESVLAKRAVTKKILEPFDSPRTLSFCYPSRVVEQMQSTLWYRRMTILFAINILLFLCVLLYFIFSRFFTRRKDDELRFRYSKMKNGDSVLSIKDRDNILYVSSSSEEE